MQEILKALAILITLLFAFTTQSFAQENTNLPSTKAVFQKYTEAIGRKEAFVKITSRIYKRTLNKPQMNLNETFEMLYKSPNREIAVIKLTGYGENLSGFDDEIGWAKDMIQGWRTKPGSELEPVKLTADFYYFDNDKINQ